MANSSNVPQLGQRHVHHATSVAVSGWMCEVVSRSTRKCPRSSRSEKEGISTLMTEAFGLCCIACVDM